MAIPKGGGRQNRRLSKPKAKKVVVKVPRPEVTVQARPAPKPPKLKIVPTEATRPVTKKQRRSIDIGVRKAEVRQVARNVERNTARNQAVDQRQRDAAELTRQAKKIQRSVANLGGLGQGFRNPKVTVEGDKFVLHGHKVVGLGKTSDRVYLDRGKLTDRQIHYSGQSAGKVVTAPALKVLKVSAIPGRAIGKQTEKAAKALGAPKSVQTGARLFGEFVLDPTTWTSLGTGTAARKTAQKAGEAAYKDAAKKGATHAAATRTGEAAAKKVLKAAPPQNKGIVVTVAGKSTSGKASAKVSKTLKLSKAATKIRESKLVQGVGKDLRPDFRPKGVPEQEFKAIRGASREARAQTTRGRVQAISHAQALKKVLNKEDHARVVNAIERGTVYDLPEHLRVPAREVELSFRKARKAEVKAGIRTPNRRRYFAHALEDTAEGAKKGKGGGKRVIRPEYAKGRQYQGTVEQIAAKGGPEFSTNIPSVVAGRLSKSAGDVAQAKFNRSLLKAGRKVEKGEPTEISKTEALFRIEGSDLKKIPREEEKRALNGDTSNLRILDEKFVETAYGSVAPGAARTTIGRGYDKVQGAFKLIATVPNPGFHARNLYGDTFNAYLGQGTGKLATNIGHSARGLRALGKQEEAVRTLGKKVKPIDKGIKVKGKYGGKEFISYDRLAKEAVDSGAIRSGFISREIPELLRDTSKAAGSKEYGRHAKRLIQNREDLIRLATYIGARKGGKTAQEAADYASKHHFDYADLTEFERTVMRRLLPFYTFSARNIPLQAKALVTKPGKYANIEKLREEAAKEAGLPDDWQSKIPEYQQRGVPFPVEIGGQVVLASPALPLTDLNQLAIAGLTSDSIGTASFEQVKKFVSMLNPVIKSPAELAFNYNTFFRGQIERDESPLVAAPSYVSKWPAAVRKKFGIVPDYIDKRSGKKGWGWPGKVDYVAKVLPGPTNVAQQLMTPLANRRGQDTEAKLVSYIGGVKADPYDPTSAGIVQAYDEKAKLEKKRAALRQRGIGSALGGRRETKEYRQIRDRIKVLDAQIGKLSAKRGDKITLGKKKGTGRRVSLISQSQGPSISDILGHDAPTVNDILGP